MTVLGRKLLREILSAKVLVLAVVSIIAVGVMCFVYMRSTYYNLGLAKARYYSQQRMADFWIDLKKAPLTELDRLAELPGVARIQPRIQFYATVDLPEVEEPLNGLVVSMPTRRQAVINDLVLRRGSDFTDVRANEVIVNDAFARAHGLQPGQWLHLLLNNRRQEMFIVGTAMSCEFVYTISPGAIAPDPKRFGIFYIKHRFAEEVFDMEGAANQVVGLATPIGRRRIRELLRRAEAMLEPHGVVHGRPRRDHPSDRYLSDEIRSLGVFAQFMPVIFLAVAATLLNVLMSRLVEQQRTTIGTLKALGYSERQVFVHYLQFGLIVGAVGGVIGCVLGFSMAGFVTTIYRQYFEFPSLPNEMYPGVYVVGIGISLLCSVLGTWHGARAALRLEPAEAMGPKPPKSGGAILLERFTWLWRRLSFGWRMTLRNMVRARFRTGVGVFAAMMGASLLVCGLMMMAAMHYLIEFQFEKITRSDIDLTLEAERSRDVMSEVRHLPGVDYAEPTLAVGCTFIHGPYRHRGGVTGLERGARLTVPRDVAGRPIRVPPVGLVMTRKLAEILRLSVGQSVILRPVKGLRRDVAVPLVQIADSYLGLAAYADLEYLSRIIGEELAVTGLQLEVDPTPEVRRRLNRRLKELPALQAVNDRGHVIRNLRETVIQTQVIFIGLIVLFAGVIFFGSLLNASLVNLAERQREVATLEVLGYTPWQVGGHFFGESMLVNLVGTALGMPLGYLLTWLIAFGFNTELIRIPLVAPPGVWIWTLVLSATFAVAAHLVVQRAIGQMDWLEAAKTKE